jgi:hypothetical protein
MTELLVTFLGVYIAIVILYLDLTISCLRILFEEKVWAYKNRGFKEKEAKALGRTMFKTWAFFLALLKPLIPVVNYIFYVIAIVELSHNKDIFQRSSSKDTALETIIKRKKSLNYLLFKEAT